MKKCCLPKALPSGGGKSGLGRREMPSLQKFASRDIAGTNPTTEQFAPSEGDLLPQHKKMAGMA